MTCKKGETGNPNGRPAGRKNRISQQLVADFSRHFADHGYGAIARVYDENPGLYLKIATSLVPKELLIAVSRPMTEMTDEQLQQQALAEQEASQRLIEHIKLRGGAEMIEQARREVLGEEDNEEDE
jgi:hypothetical protein